MIGARWQPRKVGKVLHCGRFEAMLTEPDTMDTVSETADLGFLTR